VSLIPVVRSSYREREIEVEIGGKRAGLGKKNRDRRRSSSIGGKYHCGYYKC
jgi:hypothetical protein